MNKRFAVIVLALGPLMLTLPREAHAEDCYDQCHVEGAGGGCDPETDEDREIESRCISQCEYQKNR